MRKFKSIRVIYLFKKFGKDSNPINSYINLNHTVNQKSSCNAKTCVLVIHCCTVIAIRVLQTSSKTY